MIQIVCLKKSGVSSAYLREESLKRALPKLLPPWSLEGLLYSIKKTQFLEIIETPACRSKKKRKLSGQQDFCRKIFPDKARKSRQFSNPRQMGIKGGFAIFWIIQLHFLDDLDTFQIVLKLSISSGNFPDHTDTVLDHPNSLQIIRTPLGSSRNFPDHPGTFLDHPDCFQIIWTHF